jgi:NTP pyrophosphatase (non-canonical NTP hydrolase)
MKEFQKWVSEFNSQRNWTQYDSFQRMGFLIEETGELAQAIRTYEIGRDRPDEVIKPEPELKQALLEELGDILANLSLISEKYNFSLEEAAEAHKTKLLNRFVQK